MAQTGPAQNGFVVDSGTGSIDGNTLTAIGYAGPVVTYSVGIYVRGAMGLHTVDIITGEYSLGMMGERIENGRRTHGVRGVTMAGNLLDFCLLTY